MVWTLDPVYLVLASALLVGLWAYEEHGWRLGGILVLPLVLIYGLLDVHLLLAFAVAAAAAVAVGALLHRWTLVYGRRLLYVHLFTGLVATAVLVELLALPLGGIALVILPGIFAYNLHKESEPGRAAAQFTVVLVPLYLVAHLVLMPFGYTGGLYPYLPGLADLAGQAAALAGTPGGIGQAGSSQWLQGLLEGGAVLAGSQSVLVGAEGAE